MTDSIPPRLVAFDLDDTLAPSKSAIDPRIGDAADRARRARRGGDHLRRPARAVPAQVVDRLPDASAETLVAHAPAPDLRHAVLPARRRTASSPVYAHALTDDQKSRALARRRGRGAAPRAVGGRDLGRHPRGSRLADHLLGARPARAARREDRLGPHRREEEHAARGGRRAASPTSRCARAVRRRSTSPTAASTRRTACASSPSRPASRSMTCCSSATASTRTATTTPSSRSGVPCHAVEGWEDTAEFLDALLPDPARRAELSLVPSSASHGPAATPCGAASRGRARRRLRDRHQPRELGDVLRLELVERRDARAASWCARSRCAGSRSCGRRPARPPAMRP